MSPGVPPTSTVNTNSNDILTYLWFSLIAWKDKWIRLNTLEKNLKRWWVSTCRLDLYHKNKYNYNVLTDRLLGAHRLIQFREGSADPRHILCAHTHKIVLALDQVHQLVGQSAAICGRSLKKYYLHDHSAFFSCCMPSPYSSPRYYTPHPSAPGQPQYRNSPDMLKFVHLGPHHTGTPPPPHLDMLKQGDWHSTEMPSLFCWYSMSKCLRHHSSLFIKHRPFTIYYHIPYYYKIISITFLYLVSAVLHISMM